MVTLLEGDTITMSSVRSNTLSFGVTVIWTPSLLFSTLHQEGTDVTSQFALELTEILSEVPLAGNDKLVAPTSIYSGRASCTTLMVLYKEPLLTVKLVIFSRVLLFTSRHLTIKFLASATSVLHHCPPPATCHLPLVLTITCLSPP